MTTFNQNLNPKDPLQEWDESAPYWEKHARVIRTMFTPLTQALIDDAGITSGQNVLDVAGGPGEPSMTIAKIVGETGSVTHTDAIAKMVQTAEREARSQGLTNIRFRQCVAEDLPFDDGIFDRVVCRLGAMFFSDPSKALGEMLRVTKEGGKIALAVWGKSDNNPFSSSVTRVLSRYFPPAPLVAGGHDAFRFAEPGVLGEILKNAGAAAVQDRLLKFRIAAPISIDDFWGVRSETSETLRSKLSQLSPDERSKVAEEVKVEIAAFFPKGQMDFPAEMRIVTGSK